MQINNRTQALILVHFLVAGCSLISPRTQSNAPQVAIRDVPFEARDAGDLSPRKRVMVLPFIDTDAARSTHIAPLARDALIRSLLRTREFVIVANSDFPKDVNSYMRHHEYDLESMGKIGGSMGLAGIIEGRVLEIRARRMGDTIGLVRQVKARIEAKVQVRVVNTKNGGIILDEIHTAEVEGLTTRVAERASNDRLLEEDPRLVEAVVTKAFQGTVPRITQTVEKLSWEGRVALVKGDRIYLNAGRLSGLQIGDILKVTEEGEDVFDPETGSLIGKVPGRLKGTIEVVSYFGKDGSIGIIHSGSGFRENDRVELY